MHIHRVLAHWLGALRLQAIWLLPVLLVVATTAHAKPVAISAVSDRINLGPDAEYLVDSDNTLSIDVVSGDSGLAWQSVNGKTPYFGFNRSNIWYRIKLVNTEAHDLEKLLAITSHIPRSVDLYRQVDNGPIDVMVKNAGLASPHGNRPIDHNYILARLQLPKSSVVTLYCRYQAHTVSSLYLSLEDEDSFWARDKVVTIQQSLGYGLFSNIAFITLLLFLLNRDLSFLYFAIFNTCITISQATQSGAMHTLFPEAGRLIGWLWYCSSVGFLASLTLFTLRFNKTRELMPRTRKLALWLLVLLCSTIVYGYVTGNDDAPDYGSKGMVVLFTILIISSFRCYQLGNTYSLYFALGLIVMVITAAIEIAYSLGHIESQHLFVLLIMIGSFIMVFIFSVGLGLYYNHMRRETSRIVIEEELKKVRSDKAELDAERTNQFLATMSHEIRTPINGVLGLSEILSRTELDETQAYYNRMVLASGKTLLCIINDILDFSKLQSQKLQIEHISFRLDELFTNSLTIYSVQAEQKNIQLIGLYKPHLPINFLGDPYRIQQIINNLLSNAIKFTLEGEVDFTVDGKQDESGQWQIKLQFRDTGIGIRKEQTQTLFDAFQQADTSTSRQFGGTGLGLTISKQLVTLLGGSIEVKSKPQVGSCFSVTIPLQIDAKKEQARLKELAMLQGKSIILIEGLDIYRQRVEEILTTWGVKVGTASEVPTALQIIAELAYPPDLILLNPNFIDAGGLANISDLVGLKIPLVVVPPKDAAKLKQQLNTDHSVLLSETPSFSELGSALVKALQHDFTTQKAAAEKKPDLAPQKFSRITLLVAEDNLVNQQVIKAMTAKLGIKIELAANGQEALELWENRTKHFDGILMDCEMPEMDGYACTERIRAIEAERGLAPIAIVAITAHALPEYKSLCLASGMDDLLVKPINLETLSETVEKHFCSDKVS